ncbi:MAG: CvpA family protein [Spirochaetales bacterium]|nr:CvpA family protein [Spirochaetales bacterium]
MQIGNIFVPAIDLFFTAIVLFMTIKAIIKGFVSEVMGIASIGAGLILGVLFSPLLGSFIETQFGITNWSQVIAFLVIFLVCYLLTKIFENGITALINKIHLNKLDRALGMFFGILEGLVIIIIIIFIIQVQPFFDTTNIEHNSFYIQMLHQFMPDGEQVLDEAIKNV